MDRSEPQRIKVAQSGFKPILHSFGSNTSGLITFRCVRASTQNRKKGAGIMRVLLSMCVSFQPWLLSSRPFIHNLSKALACHAL